MKELKELVNSKLQESMGNLATTLGSALESRIEEIKEAAAESVASELYFIHRQHCELAARWSRKIGAALSAFNRA